MIPPQARSSNTDLNSNGSSSRESNNRKPAAYDNSEKNASANSGYSADGSAYALAPPVYIGFLEGSKKNGGDGNSVSHHGQNRNNRRKTVELNFTASRALEDLKKGGIKIPTIRMDDSRDLEDCTIDMTKVKLVMAKSKASSPFLIRRNDKGLKLVPDLSSEYASLFTATYQSYEKPETNNHCDSSTSSVSSSSESDDVSSMPPPRFVVPPLLEDALKANAAGELKRSASKRKRPASAEVAAKAAKLQHITMSDALEASTQARVVTLSFHPFIVVHVNTAYNRLTGYSSAKILGKPLQDCLSGSCKEWMKVGAPHPVAALHERVRTIRSKGNKHQQCKCFAILVGPQLEGKKEVDTTSVTHYAVSFLPISNSNSKNNAVDSGEKRPAAESIAAAHRQVMG